MSDYRFLHFCFFQKVRLQKDFFSFIYKVVQTAQLSHTFFGSRTVLFIVCAMASFMGLLNSYREICKDREIIFREASVGVSLLATVLSKAITLFLVEAVQAGILTAGFVEIIHIPQNHLLLDTNVEIFITIFLLMAASSAMGLLVSASLKSSEAAVLLVLVLIIGQVVFSGVMFSMTGALTAISYIIVCRWGMGALGASTDLNDRLSWLKAGLDSPMYDATVPNLVHSWQMLGLITLVCVAAVAAAVLLPKTSKKDVQASTQYVEAALERRDITNTFSGSGTISAANTYTVKSLVKGTVLTADFEVGDTIEKGTVLYTIDSSDVATSVEKAQLALEQAQRSYDDAADAQYIRSVIGGTVASIKVKAGDYVTAGQEIATVRDDSSLLLTLEFPAADASNFAVGQAAQVMLNGTFETLSGTVQAVAGTDTISSGNLLVRTVTIAVPNNGNLTTAQAASASINGVSALASARFDYQHQQTVTATASGTVSAVCVKEGAAVAANTAIVQLSGTELSRQVQSAADSLLNAQLSMSDTEKQMENYTITSPISGTVIQKNVKAGDTVGTDTASSETLCTIYDLSYLEMTLNVDELEILSIKEGQTVTITADAISDRTFTGVVTSVSAAGTTTGGTTTYPVTIRIDDTGDLLPGMNATAEIEVSSAENALTIPNGAVVRGNYVLVTKDSPSAVNAVQDMTAPDGYVYVKITTGTSDNDSIEVTGGLQEGDTIAYDADAAEKQNASGSGGHGGGNGGPGGGGPGGGF